MFGHEGGYSDFFENLFGRGARHGASERDSSQHFYYDQGARRGRDIEHDLQVTLDEAFHGTKRKLEWEDGRKIEATIKAADPSAVADFSPVYDTVSNLRLILLKKRQVVGLTIILVAPFVPLVLTQISIKEALNRIAQLVV